MENHVVKKLKVFMSTVFAIVVFCLGSFFTHSVTNEEGLVSVDTLSVDAGSNTSDDIKVIKNSIAEDYSVTEINYEFKRQVASYAAQYINAYRGSPCTVLSGMSKVAQYRASQLTWNYGHSTSDKRAALAYYEYGRYIDATEFGDDASNSYWEADSAEAICAGFYGTDPEAMGKRIADLIRNSSGHWSYISSSEYSYIGVGVDYREGSEYGWYCCVMVGSVNYG